MTELLAAFPHSFSFSAAIILIAWMLYRLVMNEKKINRANVRWLILFMGPLLLVLATAWIFFTYTGE